MNNTHLSEERAVSNLSTSLGASWSRLGLRSFINGRPYTKPLHIGVFIWMGANQD